MPWFIKTERFKNATLRLSKEERKIFLTRHKDWVIKLNKKGEKIISGYLVDDKQLPGGGGLLIVEATSYEEAMSLIKEDPMIVFDLVTWKIQEWVPVVGNPMN
tara:strand:+ start:291 stop:599 length:309 start_codon:yes stop_codon:yes gene_type:complete